FYPYSCRRHDPHVTRAHHPHPMSPYPTDGNAALSHGASPGGQERGELAVQVHGAGLVDVEMDAQHGTVRRRRTLAEPGDVGARDHGVRERASDGDSPARDTPPGFATTWIVVACGPMLPDVSSKRTSA